MLSSKDHFIVPFAVTISGPPANSLDSQLDRGWGANKIRILISDAGTAAVIYHDLVQISVKNSGFPSGWRWDSLVVPFGNVGVQKER